VDIRFVEYIYWTVDFSLQAGDTVTHIAASRGDIKIPGSFNYKIFGNFNIATACPLPGILFSWQLQQVGSPPVHAEAREYAGTEIKMVNLRYCRGGGWRLHHARPPLFSYPRGLQRYESRCHPPGNIKIVEALHRAGANLYLYNNASKPFQFLLQRILWPLRAQSGFQQLKLPGKRLPGSKQPSSPFQATPPSSEGDSV